MGHQDDYLEMRAQKIAAEAAGKEPAPEAPAADEELPATPLAMDHDEIGAWRKTARFFRKAA